MPKKYLRNAAISRVVSVSSVVVLLVAGLGLPTLVNAVSCSTSSDCQNQINQLNSQNAQAQQSLNALQAKASSYQDAINQLQGQIDSLSQQIASNQAQQASLQTQITVKQQEIDQKKQSLAADIKSMYIDGQTSTIEELASSKNLSDYVDKQEYRQTVQNQLDDAIKQIATLQSQLQQQKLQVDQLLTTEKNQNQLLSGAESQQTQLLGYNQSQQDQFNSQLSSNQAAIVALQKQQFALNVRVLGRAQYGGTGSYPWAGAVPGSGIYTWVINGGEYDPLGWGYRNCTSYAFWRLAQVRGIELPWSDFMTVYNSGGKIGYSIPDFRNLGYAVDNNPQGATLAVFGAGPYGSGTFGHIMFIESSDSNSAYVSQYNEAGDGLYSTMTIHPGSGVWFVHIP